MCGAWQGGSHLGDVDQAHRLTASQDHILYILYEDAYRPEIALL